MWGGLRNACSPDGAFVLPEGMLLSDCGLGLESFEGADGSADIGHGCYFSPFGH